MQLGKPSQEEDFGVPPLTSPQNTALHKNCKISCQKEVSNMWTSHLKENWFCKQQLNTWPSLGQSIQLQQWRPQCLFVKRILIVCLWRQRKTKQNKNPSHSQGRWRGKKYRYKNSLPYWKLMFPPFSLGRAKHGQRHTNATSPPLSICTAFRKGWWKLFLWDHFKAQFANFRSG